MSRNGIGIIRELRASSSSSLNPGFILPEVARQHLRLTDYIPEHDLGCHDLKISPPDLMKKWQKRILLISPVLVTSTVTRHKIPEKESEKLKERGFILAHGFHGNSPSWRGVNG